MKFLYGTFAKFAMEKPVTKKKKQRILMLYDFPIKGGGSGTYVKYLALRLQESGKYDVAIASPEKSEIDPSIKSYNLKLPQIPVFLGRPGLENAKKYSELTSYEISGFYDEFIEATLKVVEQFKPDLIHVHHTMVNLWVARFIRSMEEIRFVVTTHGSDLFAIAQDRRYFGMSRDGLRMASMITAVSGDTRSKLFKMFGRELAGKTRIIPGGVRLSQFPERKNTQELALVRKKYNIGDENVVLFTGRLISEKGVAYLVKAASRIKGHVVIAGDGNQKKHLEDLVKSMKLTNVILTGYVDHDTLIALYYLADVYVAPSTWNEPFGLTVLEAMAAKLPVVLTRNGGIAAAVKDGVNGLFVKTRNATDIAEKVNMLLADPALRKRMGEKGREGVLKKFTWKHIAAQFDAVYKLALSK